MNGGYLSDVLVLLGFIVTLLSLWILNERNLALFSANLAYFCIFINIVTLMAYTSNLFSMFLFYEMLFLPTLYFSLVSTYKKNDDKAVRSILYWTLSGSFLCLLCICYIYYIHKTLSLHELILIKFTKIESNILLILFFIGFGIKIPVFPFYFWITKIHVETSTGYSMFLSGFLVKAALYFFYFLLLILGNTKMFFILSLFIIFGLIDVSLRMWLQTDLKKLIAYSTVYEMSLMLLLLVIKQNILLDIIIIFFFFHSIFSCFMFFIISILQKRYKSRSIEQVIGVNEKLPDISKYIWIQILLFVGFPFSIKFILEIQIFIALYESLGPFSIFIFLVIILIANIGFCKIFFNVLYGISDKVKVIKISNFEKNFLTLLSILLSLLIISVYIL